MEVRITFRSEIYLKGKSLKKIKEKWEELPLFSADALEEAGARFIEVVSAEKYDKDKCTDVTDEF